MSSHVRSRREKSGDFRKGSMGEHHPCFSLSFHLCGRFRENWVRALDVALHRSAPHDHRAEKVAYCGDYCNPIDIGILYCFSGLAPIQFAKGHIGFLGYSQSPDTY